MSNKYRENNPSVILANKAKFAFNRVRDLITQRNDPDSETTQESTLNRLFRLFRDFFTRLAKPMFSGLSLDARSPRDPEQLNDSMREIEADVGNLFDQSRVSARMIADVSNYTLANERTLKGRVGRLTSAITNLKLINQQAGESTFVAGDDFVDASQIDDAFPIAGIRTRPSSVAQSAMLAPSEVENLSLGDARITRAEGPRRGDFLVSTGLYEGKYYNTEGRGQWEGLGTEPEWIAYVAFPRGHEGSLRDKAMELQQRWAAFVESPQGADALRDGTLIQTAKDLRNDPDYRSGVKLFGEGFGFTLEELEMFASSYHNEYGDEYFILPAAAVKNESLPNESLVFYKPAITAQEELIAGRNRALDDSPGSILRFEDSWLVKDWYGLAAEDEEGKPVDPTALDRRIRSLIGTDQLTKMLRSAGAGIQPPPLEVTMVVDLGAVRGINWIHLLPAVEQEGAWISVVDISIGEEDSPASYQQLPSFTSGLYDNVLTDEANKEITEDEAGVVMTASRSGFSGQGLWVFPTMTGRYIRFRIRQEVPTAALYSRIVAHLVGTLSTHTRKDKKSFFFFRSVEKKTTHEEFAEWRKLSYEQSIVWQSTSSEEVRLDIIGTTTVDPAKRRQYGESDLGAILGGLLLGPIGVLAGIFGFGTKTTVTQTWSGWSIQDWWWENAFDRARHMIGIRDVGIYSYRFEPTSTFVTKLYRVPKPIHKVVLHTDQFVPQTLLDIDRTRAWIKYEVSFDDQNWYEIAPVSAIATETSEGNIIPQVLNVNSDIPEELRNPREGFVTVDGSVQQVRMRVTMTRDDDDKVSPVLKSYRLLIETAGSLN